MGQVFVTPKKVGKRN